MLRVDKHLAELTRQLGRLVCIYDFVC